MLREATRPLSKLLFRQHRPTTDVGRADCLEQVVAADSVVPMIEHLADARGKRRFREELLDHLDVWVEAAVVDDRVARVAGHEQHLDAIGTGDDLVGQPPPVHAGQHHVGEQEVDAPLALLEPRAPQRQQGQRDEAERRPLLSEPW